jgi:hypothetical protein
MKTRKRAISKAKERAVRQISSFSDTELFTEVMKRVVQKEDRVCYFVDKDYSTGKWDIHSASGWRIMKTE